MMLNANKIRAFNSACSDDVTESSSGLVGSQFIEWDVGNYDCPVSPETQVEVIDVVGVKRIGSASNWYWFYQGWPTDVARYRVVS